jgi:hypothetical protein
VSLARDDDTRLSDLLAGEALAPAREVRPPQLTASPLPAKVGDHQ